MIDFVRKRRKGIINFILLGLSVILMVSFGIDSLRPGRGKTDIAITVGGEEISREEFAHSLRSIEQLYSRQLGTAFDQIRPQLNLPQKVADQMVDERLLARFFESLGFTASVGQVEERVRSLPYFQGKVDKVSYDAYLRGTGLTEDMLEASVRKEIIEQELQNALAQLSAVTTDELKDRFNRDNEQARFTAAKFSLSAFEPKAAIDPESVKKYYDDHKAEFVDPKTVDIEYIHLTPKNFEDRVDVRDEDLHQRYEDERSQFVEEEQVLLSKISFPLEKEEPKKEDQSETKLSPNDKKRQTAQTIIDRVKKGEKFDALAKELSEDKETKENGGDLGWKKPTSFNDDVQGGIEALKTGEVSGIVEDANEIAVYFVRERKPRRELSFDEVKPKLVAEQRAEDAPLYLESGAESFYTKLSDSQQPLAEAAADGKFEHKVMQGVGPKTQELPEEVRSAALEAEQGVLQRTEADNGVFIFKVTKIKPEGTLPLEKVETDIRKNLTEIKAKELMLAAAQEFSKKTDPAAFDKAAEQAGAAIVQTELKRRADLSAEFIDSPDRANQLFQLTALSEPIVRSDSAFVVKLAEKKAADPENFEHEKTKLLEEESRETGRRLLDAIVSGLKSESDIVINPDILQAEDS